MTRYGGRRSRYEDYDQPYNPLPRPRGGSAVPTSLKEEARGWWVGGEWIERHPPRRSLQKQQPSRSSPIVVEDDDNSDCYEVPPPAPQTSQSRSARRSTPLSEQAQVRFNFNDVEQAVPWSTKPDNGLCYQVRFSLQAGYIYRVLRGIRSAQIQTLTAHRRAHSQIQPMTSCSPTWREG